MRGAPPAAMPTRSPSPPPSDPQVRTLVSVSRAMTNPFRLQMLRAIGASGSVSLRALEDLTGLTNASVRQHIKVLQRVGIVERGGPPDGWEPRPGPGRRPISFRIADGALEDVQTAFARFLREIGRTQSARSS